MASFELHHSVGLLRHLDALPLIVEPHWGSIQSNCRNGGLDERASTLSSTCESKKGNLYPYWMVRQKSEPLEKVICESNLCSDASLSGESSQWWCWYLNQISFWFRFHVHKEIGVIETSQNLWCAKKSNFFGTSRKVVYDCVIIKKDLRLIEKLWSILK